MILVAKVIDALDLSSIDTIDLSSADFLSEHQTTNILPKRNALTSLGVYYDLCLSSANIVSECFR